jgi:hypothetical protein
VFGAGLLIGLELMLDVPNESQLAQLVEDLNLSEAAPIHSGFPHFGAWCSGRVPGSLGYVTFLPNALKPLVKSLAVERRLVNWAGYRARLTIKALGAMEKIPSAI